MLACVCQPADPGIFRRSPIPLGAPPLMLGKRFSQFSATAPKPGRTIRLTASVVTDPPGLKHGSATNIRDKTDSIKSKKKDAVKRSDKNECSENGDCDKAKKRISNEFEKVVWWLLLFSLAFTVSNSRALL